MGCVRSELLFLFVAAAAVGSTCYGDSHVLIEDDFASVSGDWKEVYLDGTAGGSYEVSGGMLKIEMDGEGWYGVYHTKPVSGHFLVEADFAEDENVGLALIQEKGGKPDVENYTMITVDKEDSVVVVAVRDRQGGKKDVLDNTGEFRKEKGRKRRRQKNDDYKHVLNGKMYSVRYTETTKRVRIFRDSAAGFFHYYYGVGQTIHGKRACGWMELTPSKDWGSQPQRYYVALVALGKGEAVFKNMSAEQKPTADRDDTKTGFNIARREYNWSGFFGDAVVVTFGDEFPYRDKDYKFTAWSEMNYIPAWHLNNQLLYTYEFVETWGGGNPGCHEPMSDRIKRWTSVEIVEDNAVRKVFKWYYVLCNPDYKVPDDDKGEHLPEVEEYYTFYPDGSGTRHIIYIPKLDTDFREPHELGELISCAGSQADSKPFYDSPALTLTNLQGDVENAHPGIKLDYGSSVDDWKQMIMSVRLRDMPDVFAVWSTDPAVPDTYSGYPIRYEIAWQSVNGRSTHWPVNKRPFTGDSGSGGTWKAEVSHSCLMSWGVRDGMDWNDHYKVCGDGRKYREWVALIGLNDKGDLDGARNKAKSWLFPGDIKMLDDSCRFIKNDMASKTLVFEKMKDKMKCYFEIEPKDSVLINPAIVIKDWGHLPFVRVKINDNELPKEKYKLDRQSDDFLLWMQTKITDKTNIIIEGLTAPERGSKVREFKAVGPTQPVKLDRSQFKGAVKVTFDLLPTSMSFDLPWNYCMVTQNGIKFSTLAAETYDPRDFDGTGGAASFEPGMDREGRYVRAWIEHQSDARIVVRIRYALANNLYDIAFPDVPSGSPYGKGDWVDEWFYIYPDGVHTRHMKIYTGLAPVSRPFGFDREPPNVVHEFMELNVRGLPGHKPTDDIEIEALTLIRLLGSHSEDVIPGGISTKISYKPYPDGFGEFRDASIILLNLKSEYKPFTIGLPYGVRVQPYSPEDDLPYVFQTWGYSERRGYSSSLGHMLNFWHYRRTDNTLEQVYLHGMTNAENPVKELVPLAWSWIAGPKLQMEGFEPDYGVYTYDTAQKAYIVPRKGRGPASLEFELEADEDFFGARQSIINPAVIVKDWDEPGVELKLDGKTIEQGKDFRVGYEQTPTGRDLIIWLKMKSDKTVRFSLSPVNK